MEAQSKSRGQMMPYKCRRYSIRLHQFAKIGANGCVLSVNLSQRSACWEQEVGGRKSRDIMHSFAVPQEAGPTDFGFLDRVSLSFNVALSFLHQL
jgi:hypothetical protein